jgi:hypothetical protein
MNISKMIIIKQIYLLHRSLVYQIIFDENVNTNNIYSYFEQIMPIIIVSF